VAEDEASKADRDRRAVVRELRMAGYAEIEIATRLNVPLGVVFADIVANRRAVAATLPVAIDTGQEIADALGVFEYLEGVARRTLEDAERRMGATVGDRLKCVKSVADLRERRLFLLSRAGLLVQLFPGAEGERLDDANTIRERLRRLAEAARIDENQMISDGERQWLGEDDPSGNDEEER